MANVQVREEPFERFEVVAGAFDLVAAATSFHWIDPVIRCNKASRKLRSRGMLAILMNEHPRPWAGFFKRVQEVYRAIAPELALSGIGKDSEQARNDLTRELISSGMFVDVETFSERWHRRFDRDQYLALLGTYSPQRRLPEVRRVRLFARSLNSSMGNTTVTSSSRIRQSYAWRLRLNDIMSSSDSGFARSWCCAPTVSPLRPLALVW